MTEAEQAVAAKKRREEYMRLLMKSADYLVFIQNRDGKLIFFRVSPESCRSSLWAKRRRL
jgi:hypothetical protein